MPQSAANPPCRTFYVYHHLLFCFYSQWNNCTVRVYRLPFLPTFPSNSSSRAEASENPPINHHFHRIIGHQWPLPFTRGQDLLNWDTSTYSLCRTNGYEMPWTDDIHSLRLGSKSTAIVPMIRCCQYDPGLPARQLATTECCGAVLHDLQNLISHTMTTSFRCKDLNLHSVTANLAGMNQKRKRAEIWRSNVRAQQGDITPGVTQNETDKDSRKSSIFQQRSGLLGLSPQWIWSFFTKLGAILLLCHSPKSINWQISLLVCFARCSHFEQKERSKTNRIHVLSPVCVN